MQKLIQRRLTPLILLTLSSITLIGCDPISLTAASLGASTGLSHTLGGLVYKTFTAPIKTVEHASVKALKDMGIKVVSRTTNGDGERVVMAEAKNREIEILLEPLSKRTTRMRTVASNGIIKDGATATEIILQTERVLSRG